MLRVPRDDPTGGAKGTPKIIALGVPFGFPLPRRQRLIWPGANPSGIGAEVAMGGGRC